MNELNRTIETLGTKVADIQATKTRIDETLALFYEFGLNKDAEEVFALQNHVKELTGQYYPPEFNVGYLWNV